MSETRDQPPPLGQAPHSDAPPAQTPPDAPHSQMQASTGDNTAEHDGANIIVRCPYCRAQDVELLALFGAQLLTDQYYCNVCHTPFEHVRDALG